MTIRKERSPRNKRILIRYCNWTKFNEKCLLTRQWKEKEERNDRNTLCFINEGGRNGDKFKCGYVIDIYIIKVS